MTIRRIADLSDPAVAPYAALTEHALRSQSLFIAEGVPVIEHALDAGYEPVSLLMQENHITGKAAPLLARMEGIPVYTAENAVLEQLTGFALTRGVLCAMRRKPLPDTREMLSRCRIVCVLHGVTDSTNIGAAIRNGAALGADALLLSGGCCDPLCRRSVRVSMGTVFQLPWTVTDENPVRLLHECGFRCAALALTENSIRPDDPALRDGKKTALLLGTEGSGLPEEIISACDHTVMIPMSNGVDSLNVATAAAVALYAIARE